MNSKNPSLIFKASLWLSLLFITFKSFTVPENLTSLIITVESKIDICCTTLNSKIDQLAASIETDFDGTFTVLATILAAEPSNLLGTYTLINNASQEESTLNSKLDACCYTLNSKLEAFYIDASGTQTFVDSIYEQETTIESKLDACCSSLDCNPIPLFLTGSGKVITQSGYYCLANDVTFIGGAAIQILSDNVVLDLNNHVINGAPFTPTIILSASQLTLKNGTLINSTNGVGIISNGGTSNNHIENLTIVGGDTGIFATAANTNVRVNNVICQNFALKGFHFPAPFNCSLENCKALNGLANSIGFSAGDFTHEVGTSISFINCMSNNNQIGFNILDIQNTFLDACSAYNNTLHGFQIHKTSSLIENAIILNCISEKSQNGFNILIEPLISQSLNIFMKNCQANRNGNGYQIFDNIGSLIGVITNCIAHRNSNFGFGTLNIPNNNSNCVVKDCIASCNLEGFSSPRLGFVFYNNESSDNTLINYIIPLSPNSAEVKLFSDPVNGRGDNLASSLP